MKQTNLTKASASLAIRSGLLDDLEEASKISHSVLVEAYPFDPILQYVIAPIFRHYHTYVYPLIKRWALLLLTYDVLAFCSWSAR